MNSGIYKIINTVSSNVYIGSTVNFTKRISGHFYCLDNQKHGNSHLQASYNKYGKNNFKFEILEEVEPVESKLIEREKHWIAQFDPSILYNQRVPGEYIIGGKHSELTKQKMSIAHKIRHSSKIAHSSRPRSKSYNYNNYLGGAYAICQHDLNGNILAEYPSVKKLIQMGFSYRGIKETLIGKRETYYGYVWKYKNGIPPMINKKKAIRSSSRLTESTKQKALEKRKTNSINDPQSVRNILINAIKANPNSDMQTLEKNTNLSKRCVHNYIRLFETENIISITREGKYKCIEWKY